jgi:membrane fusion protein, multidrug efflux system
LGDQWIVTAGLNPGERVIVEGLSKIKPGQAVKPVPAGSPPTRRGPGGGNRVGGAYGGGAGGAGGSQR